MTLVRKSVAATAILLLAGLLWLSSAGAFAASGIVTHLTGNLYARNVNGIVKVLSQQSLVEPGDLLVSGRAGYARIEFPDRSEIVLGPDTQLRLERFAYDAANPQSDRAVYSLIKGKVHSISATPDRSSTEQVELVTPIGTMRIGGASVIVEYVAAAKLAAAPHPRHAFVMLAALDPTRVDTRNMIATDAPNGLFPANDFEAFLIAQNAPRPPSGLAPGLYVQVIDGLINLSNKGGTQNFAAGQFGFTPSFKQPPVVLPANPGLQFTPPPAFSSSSTPSAASSSGKSATVDCEVR